MLSRLHLFGLTLLPSALGLFWFYGRLSTSVPRWIVGATLLLPWLVIHTITFCNEPPFGPVPFRRCLLAVVSAHAVLTATAEVIQFTYRLPPDGGFSVSFARVFMYAGCIAYIPFVQAYLILRNPSLLGEAES